MKRINDVSGRCMRLKRVGIFLLLAAILLPPVFGQAGPNKGSMVFSLGGVYSLSRLAYSYQAAWPYLDSGETFAVTDGFPRKDLPGLSLGVGYFISPRLELFGALAATTNVSRPGSHSISVPNENFPGDMAGAIARQSRAASRIGLMLGLKYHLAPASRLDPYLGLGASLTSASLEFASMSWYTDAYDESGYHTVELERVDLEKVRTVALGGLAAAGLELRLGPRLSVFAEGSYTLARRDIEHPFSAALGLPERMPVDMGGFAGSLGLRIRLADLTSAARAGQGRETGRAWRASFSLGGAYATSNGPYSYHSIMASPYTHQLDDVLARAKMPGITFGLGFFLTRRVELFGAFRETKTGRQRGEAAVAVPFDFESLASDSAAQDRSASGRDLLVGLRVHLAPGGRLDPYLGIGASWTSSSLQVVSDLAYEMGYSESLDNLGNPVWSATTAIAGVELEDAKAHAFGGFLAGGLEFAIGPQLRLFAESTLTFAGDGRVTHPFSRVAPGIAPKMAWNMGALVTSVGLRFYAPDHFAPSRYETQAKRASFSVAALYAHPNLGYSSRLSESYMDETAALGDELHAGPGVPGFSLAFGYRLSRRIEAFAGLLSVKSGGHRGQVSISLPSAYYYDEEASDISQQNRRASQSNLLFGAKFHLAPLSGIDPYLGIGGCYASASVEFLRTITVNEDYDWLYNHYLAITKVGLTSVRASSLGIFALAGCQVAVGRGLAVFAEGTYVLADKSLRHPALETAAIVNLGGFAGGLGLRIGL